MARPPAKVVRAVITGSSGTPSRLSAGSMKNPNPSLTTSTGIPAACARRTKGTKPGSWGCLAAVSRSAAPSTRTSSISHSMSRREPRRPSSYRAAISSQAPGTCSAMTVSETSVRRSCRHVDQDRQGTSRPGLDGAAAPGVVTPPRILDA